MAVTHVTALRTILADAVRTAIHTGAGNASLLIRDGSTTIVNFNLGATPFGAAVAGVITLGGVPIAATAGAATTAADNFQILDKDGALVLSGSVTGLGLGGDIEVSNVNIANGQECSLQSLTYTAAP